MNDTMSDYPEDFDHEDYCQWLDEQAGFYPDEFEGNEQ